MTYAILLFLHLRNLLSNAVRFTAPSPRREIHVTIDVRLFLSSLLPRRVDFADPRPRFASQLLQVRRDPPLDNSCFPPPPSLESLPSPRPESNRLFVYGSVADSGPGLSKEDLPQLFQRFKQASAETHAVFGGSGLGLYVCRSICELLDGRIEVSSTPGEGSTFAFFVSASLSDAKPTPPSPTRMDSSVAGIGLSAPKAIGGVDSSVSTPRVLVVEGELNFPSPSRRGRGLTSPST